MRIRPVLLLAGLSLGSGLLMSSAAFAQVSIGVSINVAPPELPVYEQPEIPGPGYLWSPGYWAWGDTDYYWVPGTWVLAPQPGYLWTPGYWGWADGAYLWHGGYWGTQVGFYGGVNYGYGYGGRGYEGGEWRGGSFYYNRSVNHIGENVHITNVYNKTVINNVTVNRVSFNGGNGGIAAQATAAERAEAGERHLPPVADQTRHEQAARSNPQLRAATNHGAPPIAATAHAGSFSGPGVIGARGATAVTTRSAVPVHQGEIHAAPAHTAPPQPALTHAGPPPAPSAQISAHESKPTLQGPPGGVHAPPAAPPHAEQKGTPERPVEHANEHEHEH
jgi:WXXGXW repeat (2 copies)